MDGLALKLVLTPTLIGAVSMAGRRWGPGVSGWLVGFPLTSGPVAFFLALDQGVSFAAGAAVGSMTGAAAQAVFCVLYGRWARGRHWALALLAGSLGFAAAAVALQHLTLALVPLLTLVIGTVVLALVFMPRDSESPRPARRPRWDIPARLVVTTAIVLLLTGLATTLGPSLTGLLATFPLYGAILAGFAHHLEGPGPAIRVLRGLLLGLFAFAGFFFVLVLSIERAGIAQAFAAATAAALILQAGALWAMRRESPQAGSGRA
ncbi:MAG: hypothetical protein DMD87_10260 [Candidatus Rokuibacteriota bacterium]|nr:MAG: hypothetical protein DMD87_10260 [Candidatus Rokubacteria bacterium]